MGSFDMTCAISGMRITRAHKAKVMLMVKDPYHHKKYDIAYNNDLWKFFCPPVDGKHIDCGDFEVDKDSLTVRLILEFLNDKLIEKGCGENQYHDFAVRKGQSFDFYMDAAYRGLVHITDDRDNEDIVLKYLPQVKEQIEEVKKRSKNWEEKYVDKDKSYPTLQNVEEFLKEAGVPVTKISSEEEGVTVLDRHHGWASVYVDSKYDPAKDEQSCALISKAIVALSPHYAVVEAACTMTNGGLREIQVFLKPGQKEKHESEGQPTWERNRTIYLRDDINEKKKLLVKGCFIHEKVWEALLGVEIDSWWTEGKLNYQRHLDICLKQYEEILAEIKKQIAKDPKDFWLHSVTMPLMMERFDRDEPSQGLVKMSGSNQGFHITHHDHAWLAIFLEAIGQAAHDDVVKVIHSVAELVYVQMAMDSSTSHTWMPSRYGGQQGNTAEEVKVRQAILKAWKQTRKEEREYYK